VNKPQKISDDQSRGAKLPGNGSRLALSDLARTPRPVDSHAHPEPLPSGSAPVGSSPAHSASESEARSALTITARLPREETFSAASSAAEKKPRSAGTFPLISDQTDAVASEAFSILRSRLLSVHQKAAIQAVLITSAEAGDGKSVVSVNLALSLGELGSRRVLLIDGDMRTGTTTKILRMKHLPGLGDFLQGNVPFDASICGTELPSLFVAPTGGVVMKKTLSELLQGPRWAEFLQHARQQFDLIIVDSLPYSAPVVDLELMSALCDASLLVACIRRTSREAVKRAAQKMDPNKFLGIVINNAAEIYDYDYGYLNVKSSK